MRALLLPVAILALVLPASAARAEEAPARAAPPKLEFVYLRTTGVEAQEAVKIAEAVGSVPGVRSVAWFAEGTEAKVVREQGKAGDDALFAAARRGGAETAVRIPVASASFVFEKQLHCAGCVKVVTKSLRAVAGTKEVRVSEDRARVEVVYDTKATTPQALQQALTDCGKPANPTS